MLKHLSHFLCLIVLVVSTSSLHAKIFESNSLETILEYADNESLVLLDITSTLYEPSITMADKRWRTYFAERAKHVLADQELAQKLSDKIEGMIVQYIPKQLLEKSAPIVVKQLQDQKIAAFGLTLKRLSTSYASNFGEITYNHLVSLGIDLQKSLAYTKLAQSDSPNYTFAYGIIFTNKKPLGIALQDFLITLSYTPRKIIVAENSLDHLKEIETALLSKEIEFVGIGYNRGDTKKAQFDPILGIIQLMAFEANGKIVTDEEAFTFKLTEPQSYWEKVLDTFILSNI